MLFDWIRERMAHITVSHRCPRAETVSSGKRHRLEDPGEEGSRPLSDIIRTASLTMVLGAMLEPVVNNTDLAVKYCFHRFGALRIYVNQTTLAVFESSIFKTVRHDG